MNLSSAQRAEAVLEGFSELFCDHHPDVVWMVRTADLSIPFGLVGTQHRHLRNPPFLVPRV